MSNKNKFLIGIVLIIIAIILVLYAQSKNFFGQGLVFQPGVEIQIDGPTEVYQSECIDLELPTYLTAEEIPIHTQCNAAEFEIGAGVALTNVNVKITRKSDNYVVVNHQNFEAVMEANQIDSTTWDGITCPGNICTPGDYKIEAAGTNTDNLLASTSFDFVVIGDLPTGGQELKLEIISESTLTFPSGTGENITVADQALCESRITTLADTINIPQHTECNTIEFRITPLNFIPSETVAVITQSKGEAKGNNVAAYKMGGASTNHIERITWDAKTCAEYIEGPVEWSKTATIVCPVNTEFEVVVIALDSETGESIQARKTFFITNSGL